MASHIKTAPAQLQSQLAIEAAPALWKRGHGRRAAAEWGHRRTAAAGWDGRRIRVRLRAALSVLGRPAFAAAIDVRAAPCGVRASQALACRLLLQVVSPILANSNNPLSTTR